MPTNKPSPAPRHPLRGLLELLHLVRTCTPSAVEEGRAILAALDPTDEIPSVEESLADFEDWLPRHWAELAAAHPDATEPPEVFLARSKRVFPKLVALLLEHEDPGHVTDEELDRVLKDLAREGR